MSRNILKWNEEILYCLTNFDNLNICRRNLEESNLFIDISKSSSKENNENVYPSIPVGLNPHDEILCKYMPSWQNKLQNG